MGQGKLQQVPVLCSVSISCWVPLCSMLYRILSVFFPFNISRWPETTGIWVEMFWNFPLNEAYDMFDGKYWWLKSTCEAKTVEGIRADTVFREYMLLPLQECLSATEHLDQTRAYVHIFIWSCRRARSHSRLRSTGLVSVICSLHLLLCQPFWSELWGCPIISTICIISIVLNYDKQNNILA